MAQMLTKSIGRYEQTQICSRLCELRRDSFIRVQCFHLSEKCSVIPSCLIPSLLFIYAQEQGPKGEGLEENKKQLEMYIHIQVIYINYECKLNAKTFLLLYM